MSLKPPKKSDRNKSWMQPRRDRAKKIRPEYHLIVTEGTDTEPAYFAAIRDIINQKYEHRVRLEIFGEGDNTLNLLKKACERASKSPNIYRHVWVVYDTDDFPPKHIDAVVHACRDYSTEETEYHAIWSNQCIELWYLLHFGFMQSDLHRNEYWPKLTERLSEIGAGKYEKNRNDMYQVLRPYMEQAIMNAKKLADINAGKPPSQSAPGTQVYEVIEKLKAYL